MSPSAGARTDLATRLRHAQRSLRIRLTKPEIQLSLMRAAHDTLDPEEIGELVVTQAAVWLRAVSSAMYAVDLEGQIGQIASRGMTASLAVPAAAVARWVLSHGREFAAADLRHDVRVRGTAGAVLGIPLRCRGRVAAALVLAERAPSATDPRLTPAVSEALAEVLEGPALALDNALAIRRAEALSVTDDLTQLYNSRYLNQVLRRETKRASRNGRPLSLLFMDLDGFKRVNDSFGHLAGSRALVEAANVIRGSARETDIVARFGGDEFAIVLPDTGHEGAQAVGERVRDRIAVHPFLAGNGLDVRLTCSVGVATLPDVAASAEELVRAADMAMYRVKESGKNGVCIATAF